MREQYKSWSRRGAGMAPNMDIAGLTRNPPNRSANCHAGEYVTPDSGSGAVSTPVPG